MTGEINIPGYKITKILKQTSAKILVKAFDLTSKKPFLLKILPTGFDRHILHARLKREIELVNRFELRVMAKPLVILESDDFLVTVIEDFGNGTLKDYAQHYPLSIDLFLKIAKEIIEAIVQLHQKEVNHARLYPCNILFNSSNFQVKLLDLETASLLNKEAFQTVNLKDADIDLAYMAPEQSGRMNRQIDLRSNLYALGCIFYEMLSNQQVFSSVDIGELVYAHMAKSPKSLVEINTAIPQIVNDIILKLLNKNAEDRYQSIIGLQKDIEHCQSQFKANQKIAPFPLGKHDLSQKLSFPQKLYGRNTEINQLLKAFQQVQKGTFAMALIGGYSGMGKTALVQEVRKTIIANNGVFVSGKYDQLEKNISYSALIHALTQFIQLKLASTTTNTFIEKLKIALQEQGQLIIEVLPELALLIGPQKELPNLPVAEAQNRFQDVLSRLIGCFTSKAHPLVIFIDDLQWADLSTIKFIQKLAQYEKNQYLFFIGAYRDNEVTSTHPLMLSLAEMETLHLPIHPIELSALSEENVNAFVADTLKRQPNHTVELSALISKQTGANPFFLKLFVNRLVADGLVYLDFDSLEWKWDIQEIRQAGITDNVVELLTQNLERLPTDSQHILKFAACIGNQFNLATLTKITNLAPAKIAKSLWLPLSQHFIIPLDEGYKLAETLTHENFQNVAYQFAHDRAQQATYNLLNQAERLEFHRLIAEKLYKILNSNAQEVTLFDVVRHFNIALPLFKQKEKQLIIRDLNLKAGDKATEATSFPTALTFYRKAVSLFEVKDWVDNHDLMVESHLKLAECEYICGAYEAAEQLYSLILNKTEKQQYIAKVYDIQLTHYAQLGRNKETLELGTKVLKKYGVSFIAEPATWQLVPKLLYTKLILWKKDVTSFVDLPKIANSEKEYALQTLMNISATAYVYNSNTMLLLVLRMIQLSVKYGNAPASAFGYGLFGFVEGAALGNAAQCKKFADLSIKLSERIENPILRAKVHFLRAFSTQHWFEPIPLAIPKLVDAFKMLDQSGSYAFAGYSLQALMSKRLYLGEALPKYLDELNDFSQYADRVQEKYTQNLLLVLKGYVTTISGLEYDRYQQHDLYQKEASYLEALSAERLMMPVAWHYVYQQMVHYYLEDWKQAKSYAKKAAIVDEASPTSMAQIEHHFYNILIHAKEYSYLSIAQKGITRLKVRLGIRKFKKWAKDCPENFELRYQIAKVAWASSYKPKKKSTAFATTYAFAEKGTNLQLKALTLELWAKHLFQIGAIGKAYEKINFAIEKYYEYGATVKAEALTKKYLPSFQSNPLIKSKETLSNNSLDEIMDVAAILKASQVISGDLVLEKLLSNLLTILMENVGAQRGFLILNRQNNLLIEAEHTIDFAKPIVLQSEAVSTSNRVCSSIINYVWRTNEIVLLDDAQISNTFSTDTYLSEQNIRSVLCVPIINQGKTSAIIYLENNLANNVFTESRLNMINMLASQAAISIENAILYNSLEQQVEDRTLELVEEKKKADELLLNILPLEIAEELKEKGEAAAKVYDKATILFADFKNFTKVVENMNPQLLVKLIDSYFSQFDQIMQKHGIEKIKTVGDAYIAAGGLPDPKKGQPETVVKAAIEMQQLATQFKIDRQKKALPFFEIRIGIHTGQVVAGVVGRLKFAYDIWGDTVNIAARLEQNSEAGKINISGSTYKAIKKFYTCTYRGKVSAKNKGEIDMYFVDLKKE